MIVILTLVAFLDFRLNAMRISRLVQPSVGTNSDRINYQRVISLPSPGRVPVIARRHTISGVELSGQWVLAIHPDIPPDSLVLVQNRNPVGHAHKRHASG